MYILSGRERKKRKEKSWRCALIPKRICHVVLAKPLAAENKRKLITFSARIKESKQELKAGKNKAEANLYLPSWVSSLSLSLSGVWVCRDETTINFMLEQIQSNWMSNKPRRWIDFFTLCDHYSRMGTYDCAQREKRLEDDELYLPKGLAVTAGSFRRWFMSLPFFGNDNSLYFQHLSGFL